MSISAKLSAALEQIDGGARSFPAERDAAIQRDFEYRLPSIDYEKLFYSHVRPSQTAPTRSSGWLFPRQQGQCNPVFVANSLLSAIGLVRDMLPLNTLADDAWQKIISAAEELAVVPDNIPPSAQHAITISSSDNEDSSPLIVQRRKTPPVPAQSASKRSRTESPAAEAASPSPSPVLITTTTNNNRRAERERARKQKVAAARKRQSIGLVEPPDSAPAAEKAAYDTVAAADEAHIAWMFKQPTGKNLDFYTTASSPYKKASDLLAKARAVGNQTTWYNAAVFLQSWRERGTPMPLHSTPANSTASSQLARLPDHPNDCDGNFKYAWQMSHQCEQRLAVAVIEYRWAMAYLGRAYAAKIRQLQEADRSAPIVPLKSQAIDSLLQLVGADSVSIARKQFVRRLATATRWYSATEALGWGSLCLMPHDVISDRWVEKEILSVEWPIWLQLVKRVNPDAYRASLVLDDRLGAEGIQGGPIQSQNMLCIEEQGPAVVYEVEEVVDSSDEGYSESEEESSGRPAKRPGRQLRQLSLLELFKPR